MSDKLEKAFRLTEEEHAGAFERYANAFLVDDYPDLQPLGGKKDKGMDARVYNNETGKTELVVQSCVSPATTARTKVLGTIKKVKDNMPEVLIYCTPAVVATALDETKRELRKQYKITLEICDAPWFTQRQKISPNRISLSEQYAKTVLAPLIEELQPDRLYSLVLSQKEERVAIQYLEAVNLDRSKESNLTKNIFDGLIACVTRDSDPPHKAYSEEEIVSAVRAMFPSSHADRIKNIVPARIRKLENKKALHFDTSASGYVLSYPYREKVQGNIQKAQDQEVNFLAALSSAVKTTAEDKEIDYEFSAGGIVEIGHQCVLWYLNEQSDMSNPSSELLNILNTEKLVETYLDKAARPSPQKNEVIDRAIILDLLPHALYVTLKSEDQEIAKYLRSKADLFIIRSFLQVTPEVQEACRKLLSRDVLYLDTTILVWCIAESYSLSERRPLLETLKAARNLGFKLRTWVPYIEELVSHLKGPVLLEWHNHFQGMPENQLEPMLRTAPTLLRVFHRWIEEKGGSLENVVEEIIGKTNVLENAVEFLKEEFGIQSQEFQLEGGLDEEKQGIYGEWLNRKRRHEGMPDDRFYLLVKNDVNSYVSILNLRRQNRLEGPSYGQKIWYLTFDRMPARIARVLSLDRDAVYDVTMNLSYLMNCVATLANVGERDISNELLPATTILDESEMVPSEIREHYQEEWNPKDKKYQRERRLREAVHQLKTGEGGMFGHPAAMEKIDILPDEYI